MTSHVATVSVSGSSPDSCSSVPLLEGVDSFFRVTVKDSQVRISAHVLLTFLVDCVHLVAELLAYALILSTSVS